MTEKTEADATRKCSCCGCCCCCCDNVTSEEAVQLLRGVADVLEDVFVEDE